MTPAITNAHNLNVECWDPYFLVLQRLELDKEQNFPY